LGLASLKPVTIKMAARQARGIRLSSCGKNNTQASSNTPCTMVLSRVLLPALMLTLLRTITLVTGSPPTSPESMLPTP
jgi:hypothetical protein